MSRRTPEHDIRQQRPVSLASRGEESFLACAACRLDYKVVGRRANPGEERIALHRRIQQ